MIKEGKRLKRDLSNKPECHNNRFMQCCCSCIHQVQLIPSTRLKESLDEHLEKKLNYACIAPLNISKEDFIYSTDKQHDMGCEVYTTK